MLVHGAEQRLRRGWKSLEGLSIEEQAGRFVLGEREREEGGHVQEAGRDTGEQS